MIKNLKLFAACVESLRKAEKEYEKNDTPFNLNILRLMQNKVDGWLRWIQRQQDEELAKNVPPFINRRPSSKFNDILSENIVEQLMESHTEEEVEEFTRSLSCKDVQ